MTMPFLRLSAPSRVTTSVLPSGVVITSLIVRAFTTIESTIVGFSLVGDVDRVHAIAAQASAEVRDLAVRVEPDFSREERGPRHASDDLHLALHVARRDGEEGVRAAHAVRRGDLIQAGFVRDERTVRPDLSAARREEPRGLDAGDLLAGAVAQLGAKANDVARAHLRRRRDDLDAANVRRDHLDRK